ncbi:hypothetical protein [Neobacillus kokaensis]|uniref:Family 2 glycosyl transferase n=1 Tax=Neobacillus kokaensis TaxID=2759023 RepID=A0ABQ3MZE8_9BACI|nr:hypothetical protein [Neobacillus kokaensis]GHH98054.1 hypothetical protein AM1BK_15970 [Neobacillus kokaensis]
MTKKTGIMAGGIVLLFLLFSSPIWLWIIQPSKELNVLIVDKTVPDQSYREHKGIVWLLNHFKLKKNGNEAYDPKDDYVGFVPADQPPAFKTRELPKDLSKYDVLYVADSYGVYEDEYMGENKEGNRSKLLYGGMTSDEVSRIGTSLMANHQTLIAEFNTFGSPTEPQTREDFYQLLNAQWTGWMGRYFNELSNNEVPVWLKQNYEKQYGKPFAYKGNGLVFVNDTDQVVVLTEKDISNAPVKFNATAKGSKALNLKQNIDYNYWFDITEASDAKEVQANFELSLLPSGKQKLKEHQIPFSFPAVIHHQAESYDSYYFAGDFADQENLPSFYQVKGIPDWERLFSFEEKGRTDTFYWKAYVPMMKEIMTAKKRTYHKKATIKPEVKTEAGMKVVGHAGDQFLQVYKNGAWKDILIKGVNMGIAKPGSFPGETKITKAEYVRWFDQISQMNANTIRVYTIHPPAFYQALYEHNRNRKDPLYLFQGVWVNEETFLDKKNAFDPAVTDEFKAEIKRTVDLIHGNANIEARPGHASGNYDNDLSPYLLGWIIGVEWDPNGVMGTNEKNPGRTSYDGTYIMTKKATPFEVWLAEMMDYTADYEAKKYNWQHPMSFTNWVTTDLLKHPAEPNKEEDMVSVNPNVIKAKQAFYPGLFASYHIYPYYPDFLNFEEKYLNYVDQRDKKNNYAGYLHDMKQHHNMPLLVAEFGIPASRGLTHKNAYGFNQGKHTEQEQGKMLKSLYEDIVAEKLAGGLVFSWQDEWFKRTWNTMDYDNPDRRPFWDNIQTNEQHFGLLSFDPDTKETQLSVDGSPKDWLARDEKPIQTSKEGPIKNVYLSSDERSLYIRIDYHKDKWNEKDFKTSILLDTIQNQGQSSVPGIPSAKEKGIDFLIELNDKTNSKMLIDSNYDTFYYHYGHVLQMIKTEPRVNQKNNGIYHPIRLTLNKELKIKRNGKLINVPFSSYETGKLIFGNGNPDAKNYNSLADYDLKDGMLELRIPWQMLNFKDPSQKQIMGDIWSKEGINSSETIDSISAAVLVSNAKKELVQRLPNTKGGWMHYTWDNWQQPIYHERLKKSYGIMKNVYREMKIGQ